MEVLTTCFVRSRIQRARTLSWIQVSQFKAALLLLLSIVTMSSPSDIKPTIAGDSTPRPNPSPSLDIKPSLTDISRNGNPIDLTKHKHSIIRKLEEEFRLRRTVLDLREESLQDKEEISRLKASLRVAKVEPAGRDIKPDISESRGDHGRRNDDPAGQSHRLVESDDDDIVFIREVKAKPRRVDRDEILGESHCTPHRQSADFHPVPPASLEVPPTDTDGERFANEPSGTPPFPTDTCHLGIPDQPPGNVICNQTQSALVDHTSRQKRIPSTTGTVTRLVRWLSSPLDSDSEPDIPDESFTAPIPTDLPLYDGPAKRKRTTYQARVEAKKAKELELGRQKMHDTTFAQARSFRNDQIGPAEAPDQPASGSHVPAKDTDRATETDDSLEASTSTDDEGRLPYRGPHLRTLSVKSLNDRLDRSIGKWGLSSSSINDWSSWWPKTKVAKHHNFDAARIYLLTWSVHVWWSKLYTKVTSPKYDWPDNMGSIDQTMLISRIREIALHKDGDAVRGEREMNSSGRKISADSVIRLDK
jgi:hypothetical protein